MDPEKKYQIILFFVGGFLIFGGAVSLGITQSNLGNTTAISAESFHYAGIALLVIGLILFFYALTYPYLEAWKKVKYSLLDKHNL